MVFVQKHTAGLSTDRRVMLKMKELVCSGVRRVPEMKRHVQQFVENHLFAGTTPPSQSDARFWPSGKAIVNCIYRTTQAMRFYSVFVSCNK